MIQLSKVQLYCFKKSTITRVTRDTFVVAALLCCWFWYAIYCKKLNIYIFYSYSYTTCTSLKFASYACITYSKINLALPYLWYSFFYEFLSSLNHIIFNYLVHWLTDDKSTLWKIYIKNTTKLYGSDLKVSIYSSCVIEDSALSIRIISREDIDLLKAWNYSIHLHALIITCTSNFARHQMLKCRKKILLILMHNNSYLSITFLVLFCGHIVK